jgi:hypothetical protein
MHQVLCTRSNDANDVRCSVCGQGFLVFWSRFSRKEQDDCREMIQEALRGHHAANPSSAAGSVHPDEGFTVPEWTGSPDFSAAALLTGSKPGAHPLSVSGMFNVKKILEESA